MKKYLLPEEGNFYKANLHCHSTVSDGKLSPETLKGAYMAHGYSIIAYTDHDVMIPHHELTDERFLALTGYEMEVNEPDGGRPFNLLKTCHMCFIALEPEKEEQVCYHRSKYLFGGAVKYRDKVKFDETLPDYERVYSHEGISEMMKMGREGGFFVTYNHPYWSMEKYSDYSGYENMNAMEICNYGCVAVGYIDYDPQSYDDFLMQGKRIFCVATDDNHNGKPLDDRASDSFGGFTMIKADKLEYRTVTKALEAGNFYASQGPIINALWFEDGEIHIECEPADRILFNTGRRRAEARFDRSGNGLTEASFKVAPEDKYVRLTVIDKQGYHANTNGYFTDELFGE